MTTRTLRASTPGPVVLDLYGYGSNITVTTDPNLTHAEVDLVTEATSGSTITAIESLRLDESGNRVTLRLPDDVAGGGTTIVSGGSVVIGNGGSVFGGDVVIGRGVSMVNQFGRGGQSIISTGGGDADINVGGQRIQVRGGRTYINGKLADGQGGSDAPAPTDPPMPVHIVARLPRGSALVAETYNGHVQSSDVTQVRIKTYNGRVTATGLERDSSVKTYNGSVRVAAARAEGVRPIVKVKTYNGGITAVGDVRLQPSTYNGHVSYED